jgi:hypothetical protein
MLHKGTRRPGASAHGVSTLRVSARDRSVPGVAVLIFGIALLASPRRTFAQHGGGGGGHGSPSGGGRPGGVSEKDDLKDFHRAMAVRASAQQSAAFASLVQDAQAASAQLQAFRESLQKVPASSALSDRAATLDQAIEKVRTGSKNFLASFSSVQRSGLKDIAKKLAKADSDLAKQIKALDQIVQTPKPDSEQIANSAANLDKALASFQSEQLALGTEMSILLPSDGQNLAFNLPPVTSAITSAASPSPSQLRAWPPEHPRKTASTSSVSSSSPIFPTCSKTSLAFSAPNSPARPAAASALRFNEPRSPR